MSKIINSANDFYDCLYYDIIPHEGQDFVFDNQCFLKSELNKSTTLSREEAHLSLPLLPQRTEKSPREKFGRLSTGLWNAVELIMKK